MQLMEIKYRIFKLRNIQASLKYTRTSHYPLIEWFSHSKTHNP
jgi:hypothetical protein